MHDPMTVAFEIPNPFLPRYGHADRWSQRPPLVSIWHLDPELDGSDDSCGWHSPPTTQRDRDIVDQLIKDEFAHPFYTSDSVRQSSVIVDPRYPYQQLPIGDALAFTLAMWDAIVRMESDRGRWRSLTLGEFTECVRLATNPIDNLRSSLVGGEGPAAELRGFAYCVLRAYRRHWRPWWKHPRWHIHHWRLQIHPLQSLRRWLLSRCCKCGRGFRWGESVVGRCWESPPDRWFEGFRGERDIMHHECDRAGHVPQMSEPTCDQSSPPT